MVRARFFVDCRELHRQRGRRIPAGAEAGAITPGHIRAEIGEVANGSKAGRLRAADVTLYKSLGIAPQDLASAHYVLESARAAGVGQVIDF